MQGSQREDVEQTQWEERAEAAEQCQGKHPLSSKKIKMNKAVNQRSGYSARSNPSPLLTLHRDPTLLAAISAEPHTPSNIKTV